MGDQIEPYPRAAIVFRMKSALSHFCKNVIVFLRVSAQVFFNTAERRFDDLLSSQNQGLQAAGHSAISVCEWMDHYQIQVTHGGTYHHRQLGYFIQGLNQFLHEPWH